jgi:hypothetical protein
MDRLKIVPISLKEANDFVVRFHRHHKTTQGHKFSIAVADSEICGVAIIGRPVSRMLDDGWTLEVTRLCTDGTPNACSVLYSGARRVAYALGYHRLITYILASETGTSLKASNWRLIGQRGGGSWSRTDRPRIDKHPMQAKLLCEALAPEGTDHFHEKSV